MKKILSMIIAVGMIIGVGIKFNVFSMNNLLSKDQQDAILSQRIIRESIPQTDCQSFLSQRFIPLIPFLTSLNIDQCDLLRAIDMAMQQVGRIQATGDQWYTFTTLPAVVQHALRLYIKQPPANPTLQERAAAIAQRLQQSASSTTKLSAEQPSSADKEKTRTQEPIEFDNDDNDDDTE